MIDNAGSIDPQKSPRPNSFTPEAATPHGGLQFPQKCCFLSLFTETLMSFIVSLISWCFVPNCSSFRGFALHFRVQGLRGVM